MWVRATVDLGMTDEEFGRTTMRRLLAQLRRREEIEHRADLRAGLLASLLYNPHRKTGARAMKPDDFFPAPGGKRAKSRKRGTKK